MKGLAIIIISIFCFSLCETYPNIYGTYKGSDIHRGACLSVLIIKNDNSFKYRQSISNNEDSVSGVWMIKSDTIFLDYKKTNARICLIEHLKITESMGNIKLSTFRKEKTNCEECTNFVKPINNK